MDKNLEQIRAFFTNDKFAANADIVIDSANDDEVRCSMVLSDKHLNAAGGVQGGAIFTLADLAFAVHANLRLALGEQVGATVGQSCNITFLKSACEGRLFAASRCLHRGRQISVFSVSVYDEKERVIAQMQCNGFTMPSKKD